MYSISDWAILNDAKCKQLERILGEFHHLSESEITLACILLESYHAVYRRDRLRQRRDSFTSGESSRKQPCVPPTAKQLQEIARRVNAKIPCNLRSQEVVNRLQDLAKRLRYYRRYVRVGLRNRGGLDELNYRPNFNPTRSDGSENNGNILFLRM
ncbi:hypothetical protein [Allocoleopsis franciscana]|uniref:hypothetical protein n=1 Tax=Allocoleopsis franciscana TaxID=2886352 RepID=UPI00031DDD16|nr:hypothetical protein [Allocoleopsis franciscana]